SPMPKLNKRQSKGQNAVTNRWSSVQVSSSSESSNEECSMNIDDKELPFNEKCFLTDIGDLAEMCKSKCDTKYPSTLLYMSLRFFDIKWEDVNEFLKNIGFMTVETFHKWVTIFIKGDYQEFSNDLRGGKQTD
ncbi:unnamed protein product, partial [Rotaria sp. Silwood1]